MLFLKWAKKLSVFMSLVLLVGCATVHSNTRVYDIKSNPRIYDERVVTVKGRVTSTVGLVFVKYFRIDDGTGEITVVTKRPLPRKGENLRVVGKVKEAFSIGDKSVLVILEKDN